MGSGWYQVEGTGAGVPVFGVVAWLGQSPARDPAPEDQPAAPAVTHAGNAGAWPAPVNAGDASAKAALPAVNSVLITASPADEGPLPASKPARAQWVPTPAPPRPANPTMLSSGPAGASYEMEPEPPRPVPIAAVPAPAAPPPPDRWQTMRDDLARCDREGGFGGFLCDQRVRLASCEGHWGRVPQCPLPPENPR